MRNKLFRITAALLILSAIAILISARSCINRSRKTKSGSSDIPTFMLNAPSNLSAEAVSTSQIDLSWQNNANNADGVEIELSLEGITYTLFATVSADTVSYSVTGLSEGTTYYFRVRAMNTIGDRSAYSNEVSAATLSIPLPPIPTSWLQAAAGENHTIALTADGYVWAWGRNDDWWQLGIGDTSVTSRTMPSLIASDFNYDPFENVAAIFAGAAYNLAIKTDGSLWSWGANESGQLGLGDSGTSDAPTQIGVYSLDSDGFPILISADSDWLAVSTGYVHTIARKTDLTLWAWGRNNYGQLGDGTTDNSYTPMQIGTDSDWSILNGMAAGYQHTIALKNTGMLWAWGWDEYGQLGDGANGYGMYRTTPRQIGTESDWSSVAGGPAHTIGIKTNPAGGGTLWAWGSNVYGQLGDGTQTDRYTPKQIGTESDWSSVAGGAGNTFGIKTNNTIWAWGYNGQGQLGDGTLDTRTTPRQIGTESDWVFIDTSYNHTIGLKSAGTIWVWGRNDYGQLGLGDLINRDIPYPLGSPSILSYFAAAIGLSEIVISWTDKSNNEIGFIIERGITNTAYSPIVTVGSNTVSYLDTGLYPANTYYYRVYAYNNLGNSPYSTVSANFNQVAPSSLVATATSSSQIDIGWSDKSNDEDGFSIERKINSGGTYQEITTVDANVNLYSDTTVTITNEYYYRVKAYNSFGSSLYSNEVMIAIPASPSLSSCLVISATRVDLSWVDNSSIETGFKIERSFVTTDTYIQIATVDANVIAYSDMTVTPSNTYYYRLKAFNPFGDSPSSNEILVTSTPITRPLMSTGSIPTNSIGMIYSAGYRFTPNVDGQVTGLGRYIGSGTGNATIILWDDVGTELTRATLADSGSGWKWVNLSTPFNLTAGTYYRVSVSGNSLWWDGTFSTPVTRGNITISESCYEPFGGQLDVFPYDYPGGMYGWADIEFVAE